MTDESTEMLTGAVCDAAIECLTRWQLLQLQLSRRIACNSATTVHRRQIWDNSPTEADTAVWITLTPIARLVCWSCCCQYCARCLCSRVYRTNYRRPFSLPTSRKTAASNCGRHIRAVQCMGRLVALLSMAAIWPMVIESIPPGGLFYHCKRNTFRAMYATPVLLVSVLNALEATWWFIYSTTNICLLHRSHKIVEVFRNTSIAYVITEKLESWANAAK